MNHNALKLIYLVVFVAISVDDAWIAVFVCLIDYTAYLAQNTVYFLFIY